MSLARPRRPARASAAALLAVCAAGCAATAHTRAAGLDVRADRRVAVLPFTARHDGDHPSAVPLALLVDSLPLVSDPSGAAERGPEVLRARVHAELGARTGFELVPLPAIDAGLRAAGLDVASVGSLDGPGRAAAARRLGEATGADTLLFGEVTAWGREFWGLQSHVTVGVALELRDAATGAVLFSSEAEDTAHSGVSQLPLPIVTDPLEVPAWVLLELLRGLSTTTFVRLADDVAALAVGGLSTEADPAPPRVELAAGSSAPDEPLVVVARGTPGSLGAFRVGAGPWIPMAECSPGTYRGSVARPRGQPEHVVARLVAEGGGRDEVQVLGELLAASPQPPRAARRPERGSRLVRLTARGVVPDRVILERGSDLVLLNEREDGPVAVVLGRGDPRREAGGTPALTPVPLGPGEALVVPCEVPGEHALDVRPAAGRPAAVLVVVAPR